MRLCSPRQGHDGRQRCANALLVELLAILTATVEDRAQCDERQHVALSARLAIPRYRLRKVLLHAIALGKAPAEVCLSLRKARLGSFKPQTEHLGFVEMRVLFVAATEVPSSPEVSSLARFCEPVNGHVDVAFNSVAFEIQRAQAEGSIGATAQPHVLLRGKPVHPGRFLKVLIDAIDAVTRDVAEGQQSPRLVLYCLGAEEHKLIVVGHRQSSAAVRAAAGGPHLGSFPSCIARGAELLAAAYHA